MPTENDRRSRKRTTQKTQFSGMLRRSSPPFVYSHDFPYPSTPHRHSTNFSPSKQSQKNSLLNQQSQTPEPYGSQRGTGTIYPREQKKLVPLIYRTDQSPGQSLTRDQLIVTTFSLLIPGGINLLLICLEAPAKAAVLLRLDPSLLFFGLFLATTTVVTGMITWGLGALIIDKILPSVQIDPPKKKIMPGIRKRRYSDPQLKIHSQPSHTPGSIDTV